MGWKIVPLSGGVYQFEGVFPEPTDDELRAYVQRAPRTNAARCGTMGGCVAHRRRGQIPCDACRKAERVYNQIRRDELRAKAARSTAAPVVPMGGDAA